MTFKTISPMLHSKTDPFPVPYQGNVEVTITKCKHPYAIFVQAIGEHLLLESIRGKFTEDLQGTFGEAIVVKRNEYDAFKPLFGDISEEMVNRDATKSILGNLFSGYIIIEKVSQTIIGRLSFEGGSEPGETLCSLVIAEEHRKKGYGKEAAALGAGLGQVFTIQKATIGIFGNEAPVKRFTASVPEKEEAKNGWLSKIGFKIMRTYLNERDGCMHNLYGIDSGALSDLICLSKFNWKVDVLGTSPIQRQTPSPGSKAIPSSPQVTSRRTSRAAEILNEEVNKVSSPNNDKK